MKFLAPKARLKIARRFNGGCAAKSEFVPAGRMDSFQNFQPPLRGLFRLYSNPAVKTAGYFQFVPAGRVTRNGEFTFSFYKSPPAFAIAAR